jgi:hypothetical protein
VTTIRIITRKIFVWRPTVAGICDEALWEAALCNYKFSHNYTRDMQENKKISLKAHTRTTDR